MHQAIDEDCIVFKHNANLSVNSLSWTVVWLASGGTQISEFVLLQSLCQ